MNLLVTILIAAFIFGCDRPPSDQIAHIPAIANNPPDTDSRLLPEAQVPDFSFYSLKPKTRREFEKILPKTVREFLDSSVELEVTVRNKKIRIQSKEPRKQLLDAVYWDVANTLEDKRKYDAVACLERDYSVSSLGHDEYHLIKRVSITMSYHCGHIVLSGDLGNGTFRLSMKDSKPIFDRIIQNAESKNSIN